MVTGDAAPSRRLRQRMQENSEMERLADIASQSWYAQGANGWTTAYSFGIFQRFLKPGRTLELGPAEGVMTDQLITLGFPLEVVEASERFCGEIQSRHPNVKVTNSLFENFEPTELF